MTIDPQFTPGESATHHAVVELPAPDDEIPDVTVRWFLPDHSSVGCDPPGSSRSDETVWLTPFHRCTPEHARKVAAALLAAADRADTPTESGESCVARGAATGDLAHPASTACPEGCANRMQIIDVAEIVTRMSDE